MPLNLDVNFNKAILTILKNEDASGKGKVTKDSGGLTRWGISQNAYPEVNIRKLTKEAAIALYKRDYWDALNLGKVNDLGLATKLLDAGVNMGVGKTARFIQDILDIDQDGKIGPKTIKAINDRDPNELLERFRERQEQFYRFLATSNPDKYAMYLNGWLNRVNSC